jgi:prepilin-type N-terminal cleavage/methylation domain-containing protein
MPRPAATIPGHRARAFTIVEMLIAILIIAILMGLLLVGFSHAIRLARRTAGTQDVASLDMAVQQFKSDFGFLPPLVKDGFPGTPDENEGPLIEVNFGNRMRPIPHVYSFGDTDDREFLQNQSYGGADDKDYRFSIYSMPYYLMGALGTDVDGVAGPGAKAPSRDGMFNPLAIKTYEPLFDAKTGNMESVNGEEGRIELRDANGIAYRYYRWAPVEQNDSGYDPDNPLANLRIPKILGDAADDEFPDLSPADESTSLRDAEYAIVAAGPNGLFGDFLVKHDPEQPDGTEESQALVETELGKNFGASPEGKVKAEAAARADNIVRAGR